MSGSEDTQKLITAAETQANAADQISDDAEDFTDSTHWMEEHMDDAATAMQDSADTASRAVTASQESFRKDERAWIGLAHMGLDGTKIINVGKTPAVNIVFSGLGIFEDHEVAITRDWIQKNKAHLALKILKAGVMFPGQPLAEPMPDPSKDVRWPAAEAHKMFFYIFGNVSYDDVFGRPHTTTFCAVWIPETKGFDPGEGCGEYNTAQ